MMKKFLLAVIIAVAVTNTYAATKKTESSNDSDSTQEETAITVEIAEEEAILKSQENTDSSTTKQNKKTRKKTSVEDCVKLSDNELKNELKYHLDAQPVDDEDQNPIFMEETVRRLPPDLDGYDHPMVEKYRKQFLSTGGRKYLAAMVEAGNLYWEYIRKKI